MDYNRYGKVKLDDIYFVIAEIMEGQEKLKISGKDKKYNTLNTLKNLIGDKLYEQFEPILSQAIEFTLSIANNKKLLKHVKRTW